MKNTVSTLSQTEPFALPITEHALKRQAKRMQKELTAMLAAPPSKINLAYAQERLSRVWGHTSWHDLTQNALARQPDAPAKTGGTPDFMEALGVDNALSVLTALIDREHRDNPWHPPAIRLLKVAMMCAIATSHPSENRPAEWPKTGSLNSAAVSYWTRLGSLLDLAASDILSEKEKIELVEFLQDIPTMPDDCSRLGKKSGWRNSSAYGQAKAQHAYYASVATNVLDMFAVFERENPVIWDSVWHGRPFSELQQWKWFEESWLISDSNGDNNALRLRVTGQKWYSEQARKHGGRFTAHDALALSAMGMQSDNGRMLLSWLRRPAALVQMSEDLCSHMSRLAPPSTKSVQAVM